MNKIIPVILVILLLIEGGILSANIPKSQHIQKVLLGPKKIFLDSFAERLSEDIRNDDTFESYKSTIASRVTVDNNGNLTHFNHDYIYNWKNQLVKVTTGTGVNVEYKYDALGRRIVKKVKAPNSSDTVTRYVHDGYQVIEERDINDQVKFRYTYGNGIDERIEIEKREKNQDGNYEWKSYLPLHDSIGNVTALTNDKGHLIERYNYSPYGEVTYFNSENAPEVDNIKIENGKIRISFNRPVDLNDIFIDFYITATHSQITGPKIIINMDRDIEFSPSQIPQNQSLTIKIDAMDELSGNSTQPIQLLSKDFIYQGESSLLVHDQGPPRVERIEYESSSNCLILDFNETINPSSITNSVEIEYGGNIITGSIEITGDNRIKFTPSGNLSPNVDYIIRVKDIKDAAGKTIEVFSYNFELNQEVSLLFNYSILAKNTHSLYGNNSLLHGRDYEPEIGLYYFRNRYYHPQLGRFLQQDPNGYEDSLNAYQAFGMNPVNFRDPFGLVNELGTGHYDKGEFTKILTGEISTENDPFINGMAAFTRNVTTAIALGIVYAYSAPVAISIGSFLLLKSYGDSLNARLDAGQTWEEAKRGTIVDFATLGGYTPITGWDAGSGDAVQVTPEHWGNFTGNVVGIVSGYKVYKSMYAPVKNTTPMIRINLNDPKFSGYLMDIKSPSTIGTPTLVAIEEYGVLSNNSNIPGQTHHLNQNAAYDIVIPSKKGVSIKLEGNVFTDIGTPHYRFHANLERFWSQFRRWGSRYGEVPTNLEYTKAVFDSLVEIGFSHNDAVTIINSVIKQRVKYGLLGGDEIPRIPGKINQRR
jgi:RHS repeat-associated protein